MNKRKINEWRWIGLLVINNNIERKKKKDSFIKKKYSLRARGCKKNQGAFVFFYQSLELELYSHFYMNKCIQKKIKQKI